MRDSSTRASYYHPSFTRLTAPAPAPPTPTQARAARPKPPNFPERSIYLCMIFCSLLCIRMELLCQQTAITRILNRKFKNLYIERLAPLCISLHKMQRRRVSFTKIKLYELSILHRIQELSFYSYTLFNQSKNAFSHITKPPDFKNM